MSKVTGKTLIDLGFTPNRLFSKVIKEANEKGLFGDQLKEYASEIFRVPEYTELSYKDLASPLNIYLDSKEEYEVLNLESVLQSMQVLLKHPFVLAGEVMPDACPAGPVGTIPVGGVIAADNVIFPSMHSADICCSMYGTNFRYNGSLGTLLNIAEMKTHFGTRARSNPISIPDSLIKRIESNPITKKFLFKAIRDYATQGDGNHFLYIGTEDKDHQTEDVWIVTHHGSRGFGASVYKEGMELAKSFLRGKEKETFKLNPWIPYESDAGNLYWDALMIIREWTKSNHQAIHRLIIDQLGCDVIFETWNEHNFVFKDSNIFYHAKGATPLAKKLRVIDDEVDNTGLGLIPMNMAHPILVTTLDSLKGPTFGFGPHGAGRNLSRSKYLSSLSGQNLREFFDKETLGITARFFSGDPDFSELPSAYKNPDQVIESINKYKLAKLDFFIYPYGSIMAGNQTYHR